jgi:mannose-6-phosphate isomerase-like protein (cupin superfamily)
VGEKDMKKGKIIDPGKVKAYVCDHTYSSKMLMDDVVAGERAINVNEGTLTAGCSTGGGVHEKAEIYIAMRGEAVLHLDDETFDFKSGSICFIPGGVFHSLDNKSKTEEFVLLTLWPDARDNDLYHERIKAWGKSFKTIDED